MGWNYKPTLPRFVQMCGRKKRMRSDWADRIVKQMRMNGVPDARKYKCPHCGQFHVTSKPLNAEN